MRNSFKKKNVKCSGRRVNSYDSFCHKAFLNSHSKSLIGREGFNTWSLGCFVAEERKVINQVVEWWKVLSIVCNTDFNTWSSVGGQSEALGLWQGSWGRRLDIHKGGIEPQESPWKSSSIYPHYQSLPTLLLCALTYTSDFTGGCPPPPLSEKELT